MEDGEIREDSVKEEQKNEFNFLGEKKEVDVDDEEYLPVSKSYEVEREYFKDSNMLKLRFFDLTLDVTRTKLIMKVCKDQLRRLVSPSQGSF